MVADKVQRKECRHKQYNYRISILLKAFIKIIASKLQDQR